MLALEAGETKVAWGKIKGWYSTAEDRPPKPCFDSMEKQTTEREELHRKVSPPGDPIPINVEPKEVVDDRPEDEELRGVVRGLHNGRTGGAGDASRGHQNMASGRDLRRRSRWQ